MKNPDEIAHNREDPIGVKAGKMLEYLLNHILTDKNGPAFVQDALEILTCCISGVIQASCCKSHYESMIYGSIELIKQDLEI
jgi:hypothetical protein